MRSWIRVAAVWCVVVATCAIPQTSEAVDYSSCEADELQKVGVSGGVVPVVLVHGFTSSRGMWNEAISLAINTDVVPAGRSFVEQVQRIPGAAVWAFDYEDHATRWVADENIGPRLADGIGCLSEVYDSEVILVGHSMGGLAIREAISARDQTAGQVAGVVTIATPHIGSVLAYVGSAVLRPDVGPVLETATAYNLVGNALRFCGDLLRFDSCADLRGFWDAALNSEAGRALRVGSEELTQLQVYPPGIPALSLAAQIQVVFQGGFGLFYRDVADIRLGDVVVPSMSALAMGTETVERTCRINLTRGWAVSDTFRDALGLTLDLADQREGLSAILDNPCFHTKVTHGAELTNQALGFISELIGSRVVDVPEPALAARDDTLAFAASFPVSSTLWQVTPTADYEVGPVLREGVGGVELTDMAIGPDGNMLGVSYSGIYEIDPWSAAATRIGNVGYGSVNALDTAPNGTVYASSGSSFLQVDPLSGHGQSVGPYGSGLSSSGDIAFGPDGLAYATAYLRGDDVLLRVDPRTGAAVVVGETGVEDVWGLFFDQGDLYGLSADPSGCGSGRGQMVTIDLNTAVTSHVRCLAFIPGGATNGVRR